MLFNNNGSFVGPRCRIGLLTIPSTLEPKSMLHAPGAGTSHLQHPTLLLPTPSIQGIPIHPGLRRSYPKPRISLVRRRSIPPRTHSGDYTDNPKARNRTQVCDSDALARDHRPSPTTASMILYVVRLFQSQNFVVRIRRAQSPMHNSLRLQRGTIVAASALSATTGPQGISDIVDIQYLRRAGLGGRDDEIVDSSPHCLVFSLGARMITLNTHTSFVEGHIYDLSDTRSPGGGVAGGPVATKLCVARVGVMHHSRRTCPRSAHWSHTMSVELCRNRPLVGAPSGLALLSIFHLLDKTIAKGKLEALRNEDDLSVLHCNTSRNTSDIVVRNELIEGQPYKCVLTIVSDGQLKDSQLQCGMREQHPLAHQMLVDQLRSLEMKLAVLDLRVAKTLRRRTFLTSCYPGLSALRALTSASDPAVPLIGQTSWCRLSRTLETAFMQGFDSTASHPNSSSGLLVKNISSGFNICLFLPRLWSSFESYRLWAGLSLRRIDSSVTTGPSSTGACAGSGGCVTAAGTESPRRQTKYDAWFATERRMRTWQPHAGRTSEIPDLILHYRLFGGYERSALKRPLSDDWASVKNRSQDLVVVTRKPSNSAFRVEERNRWANETGVKLYWLPGQGDDRFSATYWPCVPDPVNLSPRCTLWRWVVSTHNRSTSVLSILANEFRNLNVSP
ncbi:hypothetical protein C8F01DRAFT_1310506 [Mycena amicta]|nr:hypothetical protein C8F01DRAFT_1310506 [Mycena amicta]